MGFSHSALCPGGLGSRVREAAAPHPRHWLPWRRRLPQPRPGRSARSARGAPRAATARAPAGPGSPGARRRTDGARARLGLGLGSAPLQAPAPPRPPRRAPGPSPAPARRAAPPPPARVKEERAAPGRGRAAPGDAAAAHSPARAQTLAPRQPPPGHLAPCSSPSTLVTTRCSPSGTRCTELSVPPQFCVADPFSFRCIPLQMPYACPFCSGISLRGFSFP